MNAIFEGTSYSVLGFSHNLAWISDHDVNKILVSTRRSLSLPQHQRTCQCVAA